jgi:hypothetical protein
MRRDTPDNPNKWRLSLAYNLLTAADVAVGATDQTIELANKFIAYQQSRVGAKLSQERLAFTRAVVLYSMDINTNHPDTTDPYPQQPTLPKAAKCYLVLRSQWGIVADDFVDGNAHREGGTLIEGLTSLVLALEDGVDLVLD